MPKLLSSTEVVKALKREGFIFISQRGSHAKYRKGSATVIVPMAKKEIPHGTLRSIIRQSGLDKFSFGEQL
jgi:predicted RNA binding protein YcfA (HicA-like mRNA interferase family)